MNFITIADRKLITFDVNVFFEENQFLKDSKLIINGKDVAKLDCLLTDPTLTGYKMGNLMIPDLLPGMEEAIIKTKDYDTDNKILFILVERNKS